MGYGLPVFVALGLTLFLLALMRLGFKPGWPSRLFNVRWFRQLAQWSVIVITVAVIIHGLFVPVIIWDGWPEVTVHIEVSGEQPMAVGCLPESSRETAEKEASAFQEWSPPIRFSEMFSHLDGKFSNPFDGKPLKVRIWLSGRDTMFGREVSRSQMRAMIVVAEWPDGRRVWKVVDVPDLRTTREIRVSLTRE